MNLGNIGLRAEASFLIKGNGFFEKVIQHLPKIIAARKKKVCHSL